MKRFFVFLLVWLLLLTGAAFAEMDVQETYMRAENLLAAGKYEEAAALYDSIVTYQDAAKAGLYARALAALDRGDYFGDVWDVLEFLGDYRDSALLYAFADVLVSEYYGYYSGAIDACLKPPLSYYGRAIAKAKELMEKHENHRFSDVKLLNDYAIVKQERSELWGVIDLNGGVRVPFEWEQISDAADGHVEVCRRNAAREKQSGLVRVEDGAVVIPCEYWHIDYSGGDYAVVSHSATRNGLVNVKTGELVVPCERYYLEYIGGDYVLAVSETEDGAEKGGILSAADGREVIPCEYDDVELWDEEYPLVIGAADDGTVHVFEGKRDQHPQEAFEGLEVFDRYIAVAYIEETDTMRLFVTEDRTLDMTQEQLVVHELEIQDVTPAVATGLKTIQEDEWYGLADAAGNTVLACEWNWVTALSEQTAVGFIGETDKYGKPEDGEFHVIDLLSGTSVPVEWTYTYRLADGIYKVKTENGFGAVNASGHVVIPCEWKSLNNLSEWYFKVGNAEGLYGVVDRAGSEVYPCEYSCIDYENGHFALIKGEKGEPSHLTIVDEEGNVLF